MKTKNIPPLRFPEFKDSEGWEIKEVADVFRVTRGNVLAMCLVANQAIEDKSFPVYSSQTKDNGLAGFYDEFLFENAITWTTDGANAGDVNYRAGKFYCTNVCGVLLNDNGYANKCIAELINSVSKNYVSYVGNPKLMNGVMGKIPIPFPKLNEQQKIADCLSSLDDLISAVSEKIGALKAHKKGLMQQLFPAEGKTTPALRFPEFMDSGEWKETILGKEVYYENGKAHENDISESGQYIVVNSKFISTDGAVIKYTNSAYCIAEKGDILMVLSDVPNGSAIAKCFIVDDNDIYTVNQRVCKLKSKKAIGLLLYYIIDRNPYLLKFDDGIKQTNLKKDDVLNCPFRLPKDPKEQQRIADCLSSIDEQVAAESQKLDQLKTHKKGLMQQLFPQN